MLSQASILRERPSNWRKPLPHWKRYRNRSRPIWNTEETSCHLMTSEPLFGNFLRYLPGRSNVVEVFDTFVCNKVGHVWSNDWHISRCQPFCIRQRGLWQLGDISPCSRRLLICRTQGDHGAETGTGLGAITVWQAVVA